MYIYGTNGNDNKTGADTPNVVSTKIKFIGLTALAAVAFVTANPVLARDTKVYAGAECQITVPRLFSDDIEYNARGGVQNRGQSFVTVNCPVVRDTAADVTGTVQIVDRNSRRGFDIECTLKSVARNGVSLGRSTRRSNSSFSAVLPLDFNSRVKGASGASIFFQCTLPPAEPGRKSEIVSYEVIEQ